MTKRPGIERNFRLLLSCKRLSRHGPKENGDRAAILLGEPGGVLDDIGHRSGDKIEIRRVPVGQHTDNVLLAPIADPALGVLSDVRHLLAVGPGGGAGEKALTVGY